MCTSKHCFHSHGICTRQIKHNEPFRFDDINDVTLLLNIGYMHVHALLPWTWGMCTSKHCSHSHGICTRHIKHNKPFRFDDMNDMALLLNIGYVHVHALLPWTWGMCTSKYCSHSHGICTRQIKHHEPFRFDDINDMALLPNIGYMHVHALLP
jgi:uncharacterized protein YkuJ